MAEKEKKHESKSESKPKKHKVKIMHIRKADSGGYVAGHELPPDMMTGKVPPEQEHILPDIEAMKQHVQDHMGPDEEEGQPAGATPAPTPSA